MHHSHALCSIFIDLVSCYYVEQFLYLYCGMFINLIHFNPNKIPQGNRSFVKNIAIASDVLGD